MAKKKVTRNAGTGFVGPYHHWAQQSPLKIAVKETLYVPEMSKWLKIGYAKRTVVEGKFEGEHGHGNFLLFRNRENGSDCRRFTKPTDPNGDPRPTLTFRGQEFRLAKIHLHGTTEHDLDNIPEKAIELHLVHERFNAAPHDPLLVVAVYAAVEKSRGSTPNPAFSALADAMRRNTTQAVVQFDVSALVPSGHQEYFHYAGSLTSVPYSETVMWVVVPHWICPASDAFETVKKCAEQESRDPQDPQRRFVLRSFKKIGK